MEHDQNFCLQSLKDAIDDCNNKEVDVNDGKKKTSEEVNRLRKTSIAIEKSHIDKEEKVQEAKIQKEKKTVKFSSTTSKASDFRGIQSQTRILNSKVSWEKIIICKTDTYFFHLGTQTSEKKKRMLQKN